MSLRVAAPLALFLVLAVRPLGAAVPGRDFWPADLATADFIAPPTAGSDLFFASDSILHDGSVVVYVYYARALYLASYDLESGVLDVNLEDPLLAPTGVEGTPDEVAVTNVAVQPCSVRSRVDAQLEWDEAEGVCRLADLGVDADTVTVRYAPPATPPASGCGCGGGEAPPERLARTIGTWTLEAGRDDGTTQTKDGLRFDDPDERCEDLVASYDYTDCSLADEGWRCEVPDEPGVWGVCSWFMMWESEGYIDGNDSSPEDRVINLAHASDPLGPWVKYAGEGRTELTVDDVRVRFGGPHAPDAGWFKQSFASVPDLWFDENDGVWRMWFTGEAGLTSAMWYTDSPDDGLTWGITGYSPSIDCWDHAVNDYDIDACTQVAWEPDAVPPNDPVTPRTPDAVDFCVYDYPHGEPGEVAVMFTAANSACEGQPHEGAFLFGVHPDGGDQRSGVDYTWISDVEMDDETGLIVAYDRSGDCSTVLHDFNITQVEEDKYVMFFTQVPPNGVHVAGSGFGCSDFEDNDGDGLTDYGFDPDCQSPTDDAE